LQIKARKEENHEGHGNCWGHSYAYRKVRWILNGLVLQNCSLSGCNDRAPFREEGRML
jgi:hypothetical protein